jgi:hypothetical protein
MRDRLRENTDIEVVFTADEVRAVGLDVLKQINNPQGGTT